MSPAPVPIRAVTTDVWYTLLYLRPRDQRALEAGRTSAWADPLRAAGVPARRSRSAALELGRWAARQEAKGRTPTIAEQAAWLGARTGVAVPPAPVETALDALARRAPVRVAPGAKRSLRRLKDRGVRLGIVSNVLHETGAGLRQLLDRAGLLSPFSSVVLSCEHPWSKPRPEPFRLAVRQLGVRPREAAHVGDLRYDVDGARLAGMRPVLFTGLHPFEPSRLNSLLRPRARGLDVASDWRGVADLLLGPNPADDLPGSALAPRPARRRASDS